MSDAIYQSTKALSVYNVLSMSKRDMPRSEINKFLRTAFDQNLTEDYVASGIEYLVSHGFAEEGNGVVKIRRLPNGRGLPVVRSSDDLELLGAAH